MYIRKKNNENSRIKRPAKKSKSCDMFFLTGYGLYLKPIAIFSALLTIDFLMEIRLEYLWSCWLIIKSVTDSYKYQGLIFSLFFMMIVLTSDIVCYLLIPITWLLFLASCYVWIQLVGYTERGICLPTVLICLFLFYFEYILRLRGFSHVSLSMEICRPFAANGIGYPVVTMGFSLKSYVTYKFRMRKQRDVEAENRFFFQLLDQALPEGNKRYKCVDGENETSSLCDDSIENSSVETPSNTSLIPYSGNGKVSKSAVCNGKVDNSHSSDLIISKSQPNNLDYVNHWALLSQQKSNLSNENFKQQKTVTNGNCISEAVSSNVHNVKKSSSTCTHNTKHNKDDNTKCDIELKKLRSDLQIGRVTEVDLKSQLTQANNIHNSFKIELSQCRQELLSIQNKFQSLQQKYQNEKQSSQLLEKKLNEERKNCQSMEELLTSEKKARKDELEIKTKALQSVTLAAAKSSECTESCKNKRRQLDIELKSLKKERQNKEDYMRTLEHQLIELPKLRKMVEEYQYMSMNITNLREEKEHLVRTLSDENKIKQNLITAYHSSLKEVNALNEQLTQKDYQILQLNMNGVPEYLNNQQTHYHQMQRHTPLSPSSSPLMEESNFYGTSSSSIGSSTHYTNMSGSLSQAHCNDYQQSQQSSSPMNAVYSSSSGVQMSSSSNNICKYKTNIPCINSQSKMIAGQSEHQLSAVTAAINNEHQW